MMLKYCFKTIYFSILSILGAAKCVSRIVRRGKFGFEEQSAHLAIFRVAGYYLNINVK
jgi:hypothetical protein